MPTSDQPTIAAIATPIGVGAISLIRISGPKAFQIAASACQISSPNFKANRAIRAKVFDSAGHILDDGLLTPFHSPKSFTGEDTVEFTGHGGLLVTKEVLARFLESGAAPASPGEFSQRAFLNGKLDLTQAEGIMDLISAQTRLAMRAAHSQLEGNLGKRTTAARDELLNILAHIEAYIDFPDEDIDPETSDQLQQRLQKILETIKSLISTADQGRILREGVRTVIFGLPNVGKSSLLNRLLGFERAIVSDIAGTTRDTIEETINLHGLPLRLVDTAGIRDSSDTIETAGIQRTVKQIENADLLLEIFDASQEKTEADQSSIPEKVTHIRILNKTDLGEHPSWENTPAARISCHSETGFIDLSDQIQAALQLNEADFGEHAIAINTRHQLSLQKAQNSITAALKLMKSDAVELELASIDLRDALNALGEIPGNLDTEDLLGAIFSSFCIGK